MLKSILNLSEVSVISKNNQSTIQGGWAGLGYDCLEIPEECELSGKVLRGCECVDHN